MQEYMTLEEMVDHVARHTQELNAGSASGTIKTRIKEAIDLVYPGFVRQVVWPNLTEAEETGITSTASEKHVYLPKRVAQPYFFLSSVLQGIAPHEAVFSFFNKRGLFKDDAFPIEAFTDAGEVGKKSDWHSAAEKVEISGGTTTYDCLVQGRVGDDEILETVPVTNGAATNSTNDFDDVYSFSTNGAHTSVVTCKGVTSTTTLATIAPNERTARYRRIRISGVNSSAETLAVYYKKKVARLSNDDQVPEIPVSTAIVHKAIALLYSHQRKWQAAMNMHLGLAEEALQNVLDEELQQGHRVEQGIPLAAKNNVRFRHPRIVVNN